MRCNSAFFDLSKNRASEFDSGARFIEGYVLGKQRFVHTVVQLLPCFCCTFARETAFCTHSCTTPAALLLYICPENNVLYTQLYNTCLTFAVHLHLSRVVQHQVIPDLFTLRLEILIKFHPCESIGTD